MRPPALVVAVALAPPADRHAWDDLAPAFGWLLAGALAVAGMTHRREAA